MPLTSYQIRDDYGLADPELYRSANKDDPEALLECVAMAGLVGVLRQLGDLAEFAAEIFHDLHEEVMATAARGHGLTTRVQHLEGEFPSIEKQLLSQTSHGPFLSSAGVDWHTSLVAEQNLIARGDLPRFIMDSYEECRGPPRLFLLDKFDVVGAGACLKRFTDPSFFKAESAASATLQLETEKKTCKSKMKKGSRWRKGEPPEVGQTSHAKLHQLLLEERIESGYKGPARRVKLKNRELNGYGINSKNGKSYMEKLLDTPSPEHKFICETSAALPPLELIADETGEPQLKMIDVNMVSPESKSPEEGSTSSSCNARGQELKPPMDGLNEEITDWDGFNVSESLTSCVIGKNDPPFHKKEVDSELPVDGGGKAESSLDGYDSNEVTSETDNYLDALTTMDSGTETDNECKPKHDTSFLNQGKHIAALDSNSKHREDETQLSDSLSFGRFSGSDDCNISFKKGRSSSSCSDTTTSVIDNIQSDGDGTAEALLSSSKNCETDVAVLTPYPLSEPPQSNADKLGLPQDIFFEDLVEDLDRSCLLNTNTILPHSDLEVSSAEVLVMQSGPDDPVSSGSKLSNSETGLDDCETDSPDILFRGEDGICHNTTSESQSVNESDSIDLNVASAALLLLQDGSLLVTGEKLEGENCQKVQLGERSAECSSSSNIDSPCMISQTEKEFFISTLPEAALGSATSVDDSSDFGKNDGRVSNVNTITLTGEIKSEDLQFPPEYSQTNRHFSNTSLDEMTCNVDAMETDATSAQQKLNNQDNDAPALDMDRQDFAIENVSAEREVACNSVVAETASIRELPSKYLDYPGFEDDANLGDVAADTSQGAGMDPSDASATMTEDGSKVLLPPSDFGYLSTEIDNYPECESCIGGQRQIHLGFDESISEEYTAEQKTGKLNQIDDSSTQIDASLKLVLCDISSLKGSHDSDGSLLALHSRSSFLDSDITTDSKVKPINEESGSASPHQRDLLGNSGDAMSSFPQDPQNPGQISEETLRRREEICSSSNFLQPVVERPPNELPGELHGMLNSITPEVERHNDSSPDTLQSQPSQSDSPLQAAVQDGDGRKRLGSSYGSSMLSMSAQTSGKDSPDQLPLRPMLRRTGKIQDSYPAPQTGSVDICGDPFRSIVPMPSKADQRGVYSLIMPDGVISQPQDPFLCLITGEEEQSHHVSGGVLDDFVQPTPSSLQLATKHSIAEQYNLVTPDGTQSGNAALNLPAAPSGNSEHNVRTSGAEMGHSESEEFSTMSSVVDGTCKEDDASSEEKLIHTVSQIGPEIVPEGKALRNTPERLEWAQKNLPSMFAPLPYTHDKQSQQGGMAKEESGNSSNLDHIPFPESGYHTGKPIPRPPRPRSPLIDAVVAHDKSKLRKVADRVLPETRPKTGERDSFLEQIRTQSFVLKPAAVTRPSIRGPRTNLKVAAILEKANAIRQALAGSDDDDDDDSWSDT